MSDQYLWVGIDSSLGVITLSKPSPANSSIAPEINGTSIS